MKHVPHTMADIHQLDARVPSSGAQAEEIATDVLTRVGFRVLERNWKCRYGEIDIIAQRGKEIRFVEVKYRSRADFGYAEDAVTEHKRARLRLAIESWLALQTPEPTQYQVDIMALYSKNSHVYLRWLESVDI